MSNLLFYIALACIALAIVLSLLGEYTLPLFGGNRDVAALTYKLLYVALGTGVMIGFMAKAMLFISRFIDFLAEREYWRRWYSDAKIPDFLYPDRISKTLVILGETVFPIAFLIGGILVMIHILYSGSSS